MLPNTSQDLNVSQQPSMEDILSSIRNIVSGNKKPQSFEREDEDDILDLHHPVD